MAIYNKNNKLKVMCGNNKIKKGYYMGNKIYSSGNVVTYYVDSGSVYSEEFDEGEDVLSPRSFTPFKSAEYEFAGWRTDTVPSAEILSTAVMGDEPIALYAVFKQTITLSYNGNGSTEGDMPSQTGALYYNNGNIANPTFTLAENSFGKTDYIFCEWAMGSTEGTGYVPGTSVALSSNTVFYAKWYHSVITFPYTGGTQEFTVPYDGLYQLEVWGAQGGAAQEKIGVNFSGGLGGYAKGKVYLTQNTILYVVVGGQGGSNPEWENPGGYNGGGAGQSYCGGGGGATHIGAFDSTLAEYGKTSSPTEQEKYPGLYIVAGGGGGGGSSSGYTDDDAHKWQNETGGTGGGEVGGLAFNCSDDGSTSSSDYGKAWLAAEAWLPTTDFPVHVYEDENNHIEFTFGQGQNAGDHYDTGGNGCGGGGGGLYGGMSAIAWGDDEDWQNHAGAGGSGYIGGVESGEWGNDSDFRSGNGFAKITLPGIS